MRQKSTNIHSLTHSLTQMHMYTHNKLTCTCTRTSSCCNFQHSLSQLVILHFLSHVNLFFISSRSKYYWDNTNGHLYMTVHQFHRAGDDFVSNGVTLYALMWGLMVKVEATCPGAANGFCPGTPYSLPPSIWA